MAPLTRRERNQLYRDRRRESRILCREEPLSNVERQRAWRSRSRIDRSLLNAPGNREDKLRIWSLSSKEFEDKYIKNEYGHECNVCARLWFKNNLKPCKESHFEVLVPKFGQECKTFQLCETCRKALNRGKMPVYSVSNGFKYPMKPDNLPPLDPITERLISPRIPFMSIRRLSFDGQKGIIGQVINVPVDVTDMVRTLPRRIDEDQAINICIKRKLIHKSSYLKGYVKKSVIKKWLEFLVNQPLYKDLGIVVDISLLDSDNQPPSEILHPQLIEEMQDSEPEMDGIIARQHTLLWNEENILEIAPSQRRHPLAMILDPHAEELSFPQIYFGTARQFEGSIRVTPFMMANSEVRRKDRRGATPDHVLYMAMKLLRLRMVDRTFHSFRCTSQTENITRRMLQDRNFLNDCLERNLSFLKSVPNSAQYWLSRKKDLFAMIRQLGKPSCFLTMSTCESNNANLLRTLCRLDNKDDHAANDPIINLHRDEKYRLITEDPVTCAVHFQKLLSVLMTMLCSKADYNPFGKYRVLDYFMRIEFQHRGSPHAHILLWLDNDPKEAVSEDMPRTIEMAEYLSSVSQEDVPTNIYNNQVHKHTFTCYKRGESLCRFNIPFWPMRESCVLLPLPKDHGLKKEFKSTSRKIRGDLEIRTFEDNEQFLDHYGLSESHYLDIIRSTLFRPTLFFKRDIKQIRTNTFHPWISQTINANMDIQIVLEEYSCASYVSDYINKSNRGTGNLHRELVKLSQQNPGIVESELYKKLGTRLLNTVEMSAQEAAWFLLGQPMSRASRATQYIPTVWPCERQKSIKSLKNVSDENLDSTDIWSMNIIEKYQKRPESLVSCCLADYAAMYSKSVSSADVELTEGMNDLENRFDCSKRRKNRIIRYRSYDTSDMINHKREMVLLYVPFQNEHVDLLDREKFMKIFDDNYELICRKKEEYERCDFEQIMSEYQKKINELRSEQSIYNESMPAFGRDNLDEQEEPSNIDQNPSVISVVRKRTGILSKEEYCYRMRTMNTRQRELILEVIHRLHSINEKPLQIFFTGSAGCGKTYTLKIMMETYNRFTSDANNLNNAYIACASTGKAAVEIEGTTIHSVFQLNMMNNNTISRESLQRNRQVFQSIRCIIVDEVSMVSSQLLHSMNNRLELITGNFHEPFGGLDIIFCGDFKQLPPVRATPVFKGSQNHVQAALLWQTLDYYPLTQIMRQEDEAFASILSKIGEGRQLSDEETHLIESRFRTVSWCDENLGGVVRIYHKNEDVSAYNQRILVGGDEYIAIDSITGYENAQALASARAKLHRMSPSETGNLAYSLILKVGFPYMLTANIDLDDGLVNGLVGKLRYVENLPVDLPTVNLHPVNLIRIWLEMPNVNHGSKARMQNSSAARMSGGLIEPSWVPIVSKTVNFRLNNSIRCKRTQLPITPACAITIHKSQGGTFEQAVVMYDRNYPSSLVYVALSRVKFLEGLYLVARRDEFSFKHRMGSDAQSVREIRDEYSRLANHPLDTLSSKLRRFLGAYPDDCLVCTINAQSLSAHGRDIETDEIINSSHILAISETWIDDRSQFDINGYRVVAKSNLSNNRAGGVAIYEKIGSNYSCESISYERYPSISSENELIGEVSVAKIQSSSSCFFLATVYIFPGRGKAGIMKFISDNLSAIDQKMSEFGNDMALVVTGDFNHNVKHSHWLTDFMRDRFSLVYHENPYPTTLGNTYIDLTFCRNISVQSMPYVSYFSYHRPLFNRINLSRNS